jgi:hypothetical protein
VINHVIAASHNLILTTASPLRGVALDDFKVHSLGKVLLSHVNPETSGHQQRHRARHVTCLTGLSATKQVVYSFYSQRLVGRHVVSFFSTRVAVVVRFRLGYAPRLPRSRPATRTHDLGVTGGIEYYCNE